jgi:predicted deacylase
MRAAFVLLTISIILTACITVQASPSAPADSLIATQPVAETAQQLLESPIAPVEETLAPTLASPTPVPSSTPRPTQTPTPTPSPSPSPIPNPFVLGTSEAGNPIEVYTFGDGPRHVVLIGGIHGGYEWNTILLAYEMVDYFKSDPLSIPAGITLHIIPSANPDGQLNTVGFLGPFTEKDISKDTIPGRFNQNQVDLNRNWDCKWVPFSEWRKEKVSAGKAPFSEVENVLLRDFITSLPAAAVVWWHSAAFAIFAGGCDGPFPPADFLAKTYSEASGYPIPGSFDHYEVTGDASDWLSLQGIPSITVELTNHNDTDFDRNLKGVFAVLENFSSAAP